MNRSAGSVGKREESSEPLLGPMNSWSCESSLEAIFRLCFQSISVGMASNTELISVNAELNIAEASESENEEEEEEEEDAMLDSTSGTNAIGSF